MKLTEIKQILAAGQIHLTKSLGQNFLHDANQIQRIVSAAELRGSDQVLEIGPGLGALTQDLVGRIPKLFAIEKDKRLYEWLRSRFAGDLRLTVIHADALDFLRESRADWSEWKVVSNLPYSVASPILVELGRLAAPPERLVVTVQIEVARRLAALASHDDYGLLTLLVQVRYAPRSFFKIPSACFFPVPEVDSACVTLVRRAPPFLETSQYAVFTTIVKRAFSQRRKMMIKLLKEDWPAHQVRTAFEQLQLSPEIRAEMVGLEQYVRLTKLLSQP